MRYLASYVVEVMESMGFKRELGGPPQNPYRLVWPGAILRTIPLAPNEDGHIGGEFLLRDVAAIDKELAVELGERLGGHEVG